MLAQPALPWFDGERPAADAEAAVALLADAASHGLEPRDYGLPALREAVRAAQRGVPDADARSRLDAALGAAMQRYLNDLHAGRIDPAMLHQRYAMPPRPPFDAAAALRAARGTHDLAGAVRAAAPALAQYERLREALAAQRALAGHAGWAQPLPALPWPAASAARAVSASSASSASFSRGRARGLEPGAAWPGLDALQARLLALGDLAPAAAAAAAEPGAARRYEGALVAAVQAFQQRHGLAADGVVGRATLAALEVRPAERAAQIALALERLRWTPLVQGARMIVVNVPEFVLRAYEVADGRIVVRAAMKVIVGQALDTRTPLIAEDLRFIEFKPYWNVPPSIARKELVPRLRRDPGYWAHEGFEFVATGRAAGGAGADTVLTPAKLDAVLAGSLRIRQRPGPRNALGDIKFVFPNRESVYLHHTPSVGLFEQARRDFSHGCIRVEQPVALARFALAGLPGWSEERIRAAMAASAPLTLGLPQPVPVLIAYGTALVKDGRVHFFDDLYGHDRELAAALRRLQRPPIDVPAITP